MTATIVTIAEKKASIAQAKREREIATIRSAMKGISDNMAIFGFDQDSQNDLIRLRAELAKISKLS